MKFKREAWRALEPQPFHEGEYEVKLDNGEVIRAAYRHQQWTQDASLFTRWRGRRLKGLNKPKPLRRALDQYRADAPKTHPPAADAAHFLARRAVSLDAPLRAYRYYLVLQDLDPTRLDKVDTQWMARFLAGPSLSKEKAEARRHKVDAFFKKRGGRPARG